MSNHPRRRPGHHARRVARPELDQMAETVLLVLLDVIEGDVDAGVDRFHSACPTPSDGFAACCGFANIVAESGKRASAPDADGPLIVEIEARSLDGSAPPAGVEAAMADVAGFIGAIGNGDYDGAHTVWTQMLDEDQGAKTAGARLGKFLAEMILMAASVVRFERERGGRL